MMITGLAAVGRKSMPALLNKFALSPNSLSIIVNRNARMMGSETSGSQTTPESILDSALVKVPQHGWSDALTLAIREAGLSDQAAGIFPNGKYDVVQHHLKRELEALSAVELKEQSVIGKVRELTTARLLGNEKLGHHLKSAVSLLTTSKYLPQSTHALAQLSDEIWFLAGDRSTDLSWYKRRSALMGIYAVTESYMSTDSTKGFKSTKALLSKQLEALDNVEVMENNVSEWLQFNTIATYNVLKSLTR